ncbi:DUF2911 domain-containing protein [Roseivirga echinicomitans]|uniref:Asparagine synthetase B n=1 Tax=Roseivirga echinicomitans TaxID=296218 RepID=A0A150XUR8_9BACT|nr:DUF2911 domain-containing protein [Roseivirga echinicomitans]KYG82362.1 hypothetical protein AWN68_16140 [Roseivirga echinicomitans]
MKRTLTLFLMLGLFAFTQNAFAQKPAASPLATVKQMIGTTTMTLIYSRPSLEGRSLSTLAPKGDVWRTGANTSTQISFDKDVMLGGKALKAGDYSLWTIPGDNEWTIIINSVTGNWGTEYGKKNMKETDVFRFNVPVSKLSESVETFVINLTDFDKNSMDKGNIELAWGNLSVKFPVKVNN